MTILMCVLYSMQCKVCTLHCVVCRVESVLYRVRCAVFTVRYALCSVASGGDNSHVCNPFPQAGELQSHSLHHHVCTQGEHHTLGLQPYQTHQVSLVVMQHLIVGDDGHNADPPSVP